MKTLEDALAAIEEMKTAHEAEKAAILKKNKELIEREKSAKSKADEAETAREEATRNAAEKSGDIESLKKSLETKHAGELKKLQDANSSFESRLSALLIDNTIAESIVKAGVSPKYARAVTALLKAEAKMEAGEATAGGVPLTDHISNFFQSEEAVAFLAAPNNSGGSATGSSAKAAGANLSLTDFMKLAKENPAAAAAANLDPSLAYLKNTLT